MKPPARPPASRPRATERKAAERRLDALYRQIREILASARDRAWQAVNAAMVGAYWEVGRVIVADEQAGKERAGYGKRVLEGLGLNGAIHLFRPGPNGGPNGQELGNTLECRKLGGPFGVVKFWVAPSVFGGFWKPRSTGRRRIRL